ncbi:MAG TPA: 50S ribosomal protein L6 [candidate division Zixibacteria bacterium]|nr:50S ribosomal protein L6 [candidate division Zixibacteria bacterium]
MPKAVYVEKTVETSDGVTLDLKGMKVTVTGPKGKLERDFHGEPVQMELKKNKLHLSVAFPRKREQAMLGTIEAHVKNMIVGVTEGYTYKLTIVYSHFPITVEVKPGETVIIKNLYGQRDPRKAKIQGNVNVKVEGDEIIVTGINKEHVGQTSANIQEVCKLRGKLHKDPRRFMDGIWLSAQFVGIE